MHLLELFEQSSIRIPRAEYGYWIMSDGTAASVNENHAETLGELGYNIEPYDPDTDEFLLDKLFDEVEYDGWIRVIADQKRWVEFIVDLKRPSIMALRTLREMVDGPEYNNYFFNNKVYSHKRKAIAHINRLLAAGPEILEQKDWAGGKHPSQMSQDEFMKLHHTGYIDPSVYKEYAKDLSWLGTPQKYPKVVGKHGSIEFRKSGEPLKYVATDEEGEIIRDKDGTATYMSKEEMINQGLALEDQAVVAFDGDRPIGFVSNEWGAVGVWVLGDYQKRGIGVALTKMFMKENPHMTLGQMTPAGQKLAQKTWKSFQESQVTESMADQLINSKVARKFAFVAMAIKLYKDESTMIDMIERAADEFVQRVKGGDYDELEDAEHDRDIILDMIRLVSDKLYLHDEIRKSSQTAQILAGRVDLARIGSFQANLEPLSGSEADKVPTLSQ